MYSIKRAAKIYCSTIKAYGNLNLVKLLSSIKYEYSVNEGTSLNYTDVHPREHSKDHLGLWHKLDAGLVKRLYSFGGLTEDHKSICDSVREHSLLIREPYLTAVELIKKSDLKFSPNKFIFYGRDQTGKTVSLAHVLYFLALENFFLLHIPVPARWLTLFREVVPSAANPGDFDHTVDAALWLQHFRQQNEPLLNNPEIVTSEDYEWTQRETTPKGSPLTNLLDIGISRARYSCRCISQLVKELKILASNDKLKLAVAIDGVNCFFVNEPEFFRDDRSRVYADHFTLFQAFTPLFKKDWHGGLFVCSTDVVMSPKNRRLSHLPRYLLGREGWATMDPFVPIPVAEYSKFELETVVDYYVQKKWLQHPSGSTPQGKQELDFTSGRIPGELMKIINAH